MFCKVPADLENNPEQHMETCVQGNARLQTLRLDQKTEQFFYIFFILGLKKT